MFCYPAVAGYHAVSAMLLLKKVMGILWKPHLSASQSVRPSVTLSPKPLGGKFTKLATWLLHVVRVCERNIISVCPSICLSYYLLITHWVEFNQTCCMTSLRGEGVLEQHYFSIHFVIHQAISSISMECGTLWWRVIDYPFYLTLLFALTLISSAFGNNFPTLRIAASKRKP